MDYPEIKQSDYTYSEPIPVKKWNGGMITVKVGYVRKHPENNCVVLNKTWANGEQKFNVKTDDWVKIKQAVESLLPGLDGATSDADIEQAITKVTKEKELLDLLAQYPDMLSHLPSSIDILSLPEANKQALRKLLQTGQEVASLVINKLAEQPPEDLEGFAKILEEFRLSTINALITHVNSRLKFIDLFEKKILDDQSYERRGPDSIHNLLKANMWLIDRNYSVLFDDDTLRNIILEQWGKTVTPEVAAANRPDFLCMRNRNSRESHTLDLVLIEIKRPTVKITMAHTNQVMSYKTTLQQHSGKSISSFKSFIIGREVNEIVRSNDLAASGFIVKTYQDFISEARQFYEEYCDIIQKEQYAF